MLVLAALATFLCAPAVRAQDKTEAQVKEVVGQFTKAVKGKDIVNLMRVQEVPFFFDGKRNITELDELRKLWTGVLEKKDLAQAEFQIEEIQVFEKAQERFSEKERELLKDVMKKDDRVVRLSVLQKGKTTEGLRLLVRLKDGKAKIVGLRD